MHAIFDHCPPVSLLCQAHQTLDRERPGLRRREAAAALNCSEAALVDAQCALRRVRLDDRFAAQIEALHRLGHIMTLTRNAAAVHERKGCYPRVRVKGVMGLVIGQDRKIDLRLILSRWRHGFAVAEPVKDGVRYSLQYFDAQGSAVQKIFLQPDGSLEAYIDLVREFRAADQGAPLSLAPLPEAEAYVADERVDVAALVEEWDGLTDVHQFFGMLKRHRVSRQQAFRLVGAAKAEPFAPARMTRLLEQAAQRGVPIMCFVGNRGTIQIHSGAIRTVKTLGAWLNVLDPEFNLHLRMDKISHAWLVRKPSRDGVITSLELYMANGELAAQFFGVCREGRAENPQWRALAESVREAESACA